MSRYAHAPKQQHPPPYPSVVMARRRLIRRLLLLDRIRSYPFDLLLSLNESIVSIDWDDYVPHTLAIGTALQMLFVVTCKLQLHNKAVSDRRHNSVFRTDSRTYKSVVGRAINGGSPDPGYVASERGSTHFSWVLSVFIGIIFISSVLNALNVLWLPYRNYTLLNTSTAHAKPKGSHVVKQNVLTEPERGVVDRLLSYFDRSVYESESEDESDASFAPTPVNKDVWVLQVWDPAPFQIHLFATFSPLLLFCLWLAADLALWRLLVAVSLQNMGGFWVTSKFLLLVADKQIVYQETFNEYNRKYVIPKTSVLRKNAVVDATRGPRASARMTVYDDVAPHLQSDHVFVTHDINGRRIKSVLGDKISSAAPSRLASRVTSQVPSRAVSPSRPVSPSRDKYSLLLPSRFGASDLRDRYDERPSFIDDTATTHLGWITLSTPYARGGERDRRNSRYSDTFARDTFVRPASRPASPTKTPSRYAFNQSMTQRTQFSPESYLSRPNSPTRSPSPNKRRWQ